MSLRELKALLTDSSRSVETLQRTRAMTPSLSCGDNSPAATLGIVPDGVEGSADSGETRSLRHQLAQADRTDHILKLRLEELERKMEYAQTEMELNHMKTLEAQ